MNKPKNNQTTTTKSNQNIKYSYSVFSYSLYRQNYAIWRTFPVRLGNQFENEWLIVLKTMSRQIYAITLRWYPIPGCTGNNYSQLMLWHLILFWESIQYNLCSVMLLVTVRWWHWRVNTDHLTMGITSEQLEDQCWLLSRTSHKHNQKKKELSWKEVRLLKKSRWLPNQKGHWRVFFSEKSFLSWAVISVMKIYLKIASELVSQTNCWVEIVGWCAWKEVLHTCGSIYLKVLNKETILTQISDTSQLQTADGFFFFPWQILEVEKSIWLSYIIHYV